MKGDTKSARRFVRPWTGREILDFKKAWNAGTPKKELATMFDRTLRAIENKRLVLGLKARDRRVSTEPTKLLQVVIKTSTWTIVKQRARDRQVKLSVIVRELLEHACEEEPALVS